MFVDESFPLWAVSSVEKGGLAWSSARVGAALAAMGCGMVVFQMVRPEPFPCLCPWLLAVAHKVAPFMCCSHHVLPTPHTP